MSWSVTDKERRRQSTVAAEITGQRWCQHGAHYAPAETLWRIQTKNGARDICAACQARRKPGAQG